VAQVYKATRNASRGTKLAQESNKAPKSLINNWDKMAERVST